MLGKTFSETQCFGKPVFGKPVFRQSVFGKPCSEKNNFGKPVLGAICDEQFALSTVMGKQVFGKPVVGQPVFGKPVFGQPVFFGSYANISWKTNTCFPNIGHSLANTANHWPTTGQQCPQIETLTWTV